MIQLMLKDVFRIGIHVLQFSKLQLLDQTLENYTASRHFNYRKSAGDEMKLKPSGVTSGSRYTVHTWRWTTAPNIEITTMLLFRSARVFLNISGSGSFWGITDRGWNKILPPPSKFWYCNYEYNDKNWHKNNLPKIKRLCVISF